MTEEHPFNNRTTYGATKIANEQMLRAIYEQHKLPYIGMRYMNIYGPRMDYEGTYVSVIMKVLDRIFAGERPVVFGDGSQVYDFVHVADVARANILGMQADCADEHFNIGMGVGTSINELVAAAPRADRIATADHRVSPAGAELRDASHRQHREGRAPARLPRDDSVARRAQVGRRLADGSACRRLGAMTATHNVALSFPICR